MNVKRSLIAMLVVCSLPQLLVGQDKAEKLQAATNTIIEDSKRAESQPEMVALQLSYLQAKDVLGLLQEADYHRKGSIAADTESNRILVHAPRKAREEIEQFVRILEQLPQHKTSQKQAAEKKLSLQIEVPSGSTFKWVGGDGGISQSPIGLVGSFKVPGSNVFRLTNIPGHERLVVEARMDIPQIDAETAAGMSSNLNLVVASPSDLIDLTKGVAIHKFITGPHALTADQTELFDEVVKLGDEALQEGSPETKGKGIVAVVHLTGVVGRSSETSDIDPLVARSAPTPKKSAEAIHGQSKASADSTVAAADVASVSREFTAAEDRVAELTEKLSKLGGADSEKATMLQKQLTEAASRSFKLRQQLHQTQIDIQRAKLDALEHRVARRSETAQQIINQRVGEILKTAGVSANTANTKGDTVADKSHDRDVSIEYSEELDIATVRGNKADVERTKNVIEQIKKQSTKGEDKR